MTRLELPGHDAVGLRADNPGPLTLSGTNTWILGRDPAWVIDPGPALPAHLDAVSAEIDARGGLGALLLTHDHPDHAEAAPELARRFSPVPLAAARGTVSALLADGDRYGPFTVLSTPGHSPDHLTFLASGVASTGDFVLGAGSVFVAGQMSAYLAALERLRALSPKLLAPGHGPLVADPDAWLGAYIEHRRERERALVAALERGLRSSDELLDAVWSDAPMALREMAAVTLAAHLGKLTEEGRLPQGWPTQG